MIFLKQENAMTTMTRNFKLLKHFYNFHNDDEEVRLGIEKGGAPGGATSQS